MGLIKSMITNMVLEKVEDVVITKVGKNLEKTRSLEAVLDNVQANKLIIEKKKFSYRDAYNIYLEKKKKKYCIKIIKDFFSKPYIILEDNEENNIVSIEPLKEYRNKYLNMRYSVKMNNKEIGTVKKRKTIKYFIDSEFNDWFLTLDLLKQIIYIYDKENNIIAKFTRTLSSTETYVMEYINKDNELLMIIMFMAHKLDLANSSDK